jgi:hypothetical protein
MCRSIPTLFVAGFIDNQHTSQRSAPPARIEGCLVSQKGLQEFDLAHQRVFGSILLDPEFQHSVQPGSLISSRVFPAFVDLFLHVYLCQTHQLILRLAHSFPLHPGGSLFDFLFRSMPQEV